MYPENPENQGSSFQQQQSSFSKMNNPMSQIPVPDATTILVLGIVSIVTACCCYGIVGAIIGFITLSMAQKAKRVYESNPSAYTVSSMSNISTGKICAIIGLVIGALALIGYIIAISIYGFGILTNPEVLKGIMQNA